MIMFGCVNKPGKYDVALVATNKHGSTTKHIQSRIPLNLPKENEALLPNIDTSSRTNNSGSHT